MDHTVPFHKVLLEVLKGVADVSTLKLFERLIMESTIPADHKLIMSAYTNSLVASIIKAAMGSEGNHDDAIEQATVFLQPKEVLTKLALEMIEVT